MCSEAGIKFHVVVFPLLYQLENYPFEDVEREITGFANHNNIATSRLIDAFRGKDARSLWVSSGNQHPNELGHRIAADGIWPVIESLVSTTGNK